MSAGHAAADQSTDDRPRPLQWRPRQPAGRNVRCESRARRPRPAGVRHRRGRCRCSVEPTPVRSMHVLQCSIQHWVVEPGERRLPGPLDRGWPGTDPEAMKSVAEGRALALIRRPGILEAWTKISRPWWRDSTRFSRRITIERCLTAAALPSCDACRRGRPFPVDSPLGRHGGRPKRRVWCCGAGRSLTVHGERRADVVLREVSRVVGEIVRACSAF